MKKVTNYLELDLDILWQRPQTLEWANSNEDAIHFALKTEGRWCLANWHDWQSKDRKCVNWGQIFFKEGRGMAQPTMHLK